MGSRWSASATEESSSSSSSSSNSAPSASSSNEPNSTGGRAAGRCTRHRRKRNRAETEEREDPSSPTDSSRSSFLRRKKRRLSTDGRSMWTSSLSLSSAYNAIADSMSFFFAKVFLYAAELAAKSAKPGELAEEGDLIKGIIQSLDCFQNTDLDILRRGWRVLCVCSKDCDPATVTALFQEGSTLESDLAAVLTGMERHPERIKIQLLGFRALRTILVTENNERWDALFDARAIPVFIQAMRTHSNDVVIQGLGITFLAMLVREINSRPREQVVNLGGIQLIIEAMRNFDDDPRLLHTACYALLQFGFNRRIREMILALDGVDLFSEVMENHINDSDVVDLCLSALGKLGDRRIFDWGTISEVILKVMGRWPRISSIQGHCLVLLIRGAGRLPMRYTKDAIRLTVQVMKNYPSTPTLQFFSCAVLRELLEGAPATSHVRKWVLEEGGMECVVWALVHHRDHFGLQPMGLLALMNVLEHRTPGEAAATTAFGGDERAVAAITGVQLELVQDDGN